MTRKEFRQVAKAINQRMVEAERRGTYSKEYNDIKTALKAAGCNRLPENYPGLDVVSQDADVFTSSDKRAMEMAKIAERFKNVKRFWDTMPDSTVPKRKARSAEAVTYANNARKVIARMRAMEKEGFTDTQAYKRLKGVLEMNGINGTPPAMPENLPPKSVLSELNSEFAKFIQSKVTTAKGRSATADEIAEDRLTKNPIFSGRTLEERVNYSYLFMAGSFEKLREYLESDQILEITSITTRSGRYKGRKLHDIIYEIGMEYATGERADKYNMSVSTFTSKALRGEIPALAKII